MQHITGISRNRMTIASLEFSISANNPIRFIYAFTENIDLKALELAILIQYFSTQLYVIKRLTFEIAGNS